ncbi:putative membrane protein [Kosakonia sp. 1610]
MKKSRKILINVAAAIISFLIIPEIILRTVPNDILGRLSDFTSLGGLFSPFLSSIVFFAVSSILFGILAVYVVGKIYCAITREKH